MHQKGTPSAQAGDQARCQLNRGMRHCAHNNMCMERGHNQTWWQAHNIAVAVGTHVCSWDNQGINQSIDHKNLLSPSTFHEIHSFFPTSLPTGYPPPHRSTNCSRWHHQVELCCCTSTCYCCRTFPPSQRVSGAAGCAKHPVQCALWSMKSRQASHPASAHPVRCCCAYRCRHHRHCCCCCHAANVRQQPRARVQSPPPAEQ